MQRYTVYFIWKLLYMFRVVIQPIIRSANNCIYSIWYLSHRYCYLPLSWKSWNWFECAVGSVHKCSCSPAVSKHLWHIPFMCLQWKTPDDGQRNCPKHAEFNSKNKFEKLLHLVDFIISNLIRCTVTWTSNSFKQSTAAGFLSASPSSGINSHIVAQLFNWKMHHA
jgi:hypothetical protein